MEQTLFWFDLLTVVLMLAAFGFAYSSFSRTRLVWLRSYLVYLAGYAIWLLLSAYSLFQAVYLPHALVGLSSAAAAIRTVASLAVLYAGPLMALRISRDRIDRKVSWLLTLPVAFVFGAVLVYYATGSARVALVPNGVFNFYLGVLFFFAALESTRSKPGSLRAAFRPFFWFSAVAYLVLLASNILAAKLPATARLPYFTVGLAALYCFIWSIATVTIFLRRMARRRNTHAKGTRALG